MTSGYKMLAKPAIKSEIIRQAEERLFTEMLPLALEAHSKLLSEKAIPAGARVQAVKLTYDRTLGDGQEKDQDREPSEMTAAELQRSIASLQAELEGRPLKAKDVTPAQPKSTDPGSVFD